MYYIYLITNNINGKVYIGRTGEKKPETRWRKHIREARNRCKHHLHKAIRFYGEENFTFTILCWVQDEEASNRLEKFYIQEYDSRNSDKGYNMTEGGDGARVLREESVRKMKEFASDRFSDKNRIPWYRSDISVEKIVDLRSKGISIEEITNTLKISVSTVYDRLKKAGIDRPGRKLPLDTDSIRSLYLSGKTAEEIANDMGTTKYCILRRLTKEGIPRRRPGARIKHGKYSIAGPQRAVVEEAFEDISGTPGL